jgi:hypothetical protein
LAGRADDDAIFNIVYKYAVEFIYGKRTVRICESHVGILSFIIQFYSIYIHCIVLTSR